MPILGKASHRLMETSSLEQVQSHRLGVSVAELHPYGGAWPDSLTYALSHVIFSIIDIVSGVGRHYCDILPYCNKMTVS